MLIFRYYPIIGGSERQLQHLSKKLASGNFNVFILTKKYKKLCKFEIVDDIPVYRLRTIGKGFKGKFSMFTFIINCSLFLIKNKKKYDVIHIHGASPFGSIAAFIGKRLSKKVILKIATGGKYGDLAGLKTSLFGNFQKKLYKKYCDIYIAISLQLREELINSGFDENKIYNIPNGVDSHLFRPVNVQKKENIKSQLSLSSQNIVTFVGRLVQRKGIDILLKSWPKVLKKFPNSHLIIIGSGPNEKSFKILSKVINCENSVSFKGNIDNIIPYLQCSDIFVLPSRSEGLSNALLEAMATGLPVIATNIGGTLDIIKNGYNGIIVKKEDPKQLSEAIIKILKDKDLAEILRKNARKSAIKNYSLQSISEKYIEIYKYLLAKSASKI